MWYARRKFSAQTVRAADLPVSSRSGKRWFRPSPSSGSSHPACNTNFREVRFQSTVRFAALYGHKTSGRTNPLSPTATSGSRRGDRLKRQWRISPAHRAADSDPGRLGRPGRKPGCNVQFQSGQVGEQWRHASRSHRFRRPPTGKDPAPRHPGQQAAMARPLAAIG